MRLLRIVTPTPATSEKSPPPFSSSLARLLAVDKSVSTHEIQIEIIEFLDDIPPYAILSHTWADEEVSFQDMQNPGVAKMKKGYAKIIGACQLARKEGLKYIWVDSCCINQESSAELSEALNSMYQYYADSAVCYAYLFDVQSDEDPRMGDSSFRRCKWFTRGWTLQELLAPSEVVFFDQHWTRIGTKLSLHDAISNFTGIPEQVLFGDYDGVSVAKKMSWAALRQTTRPEDCAYSLMGIFGVNMPVIYGEGLTNAFMRLQREIIISSDDRSIFAWVAASDDFDLDNRGLLARSPFDFRLSRNIGVSDFHLQVGRDSSFSTTNSGLRIHLPLKFVPPPTDDSDGYFLAFLCCQDEESQQHVAICLQHKGGHHYVRCRANQLKLESESLPDSQDVKRVDVKDSSRLFMGSGLQVGVRWSYPDSSWCCAQWLYQDSMWCQSTSTHLMTLTRRDQLFLSFECDQYGFGVAMKVSNNALLTNLIMDLDSSPDPPNGIFPEPGSGRFQYYKSNSNISKQMSRSFPHTRQDLHSVVNISKLPPSYFYGRQSPTGVFVGSLPNKGRVYLTVHKTSHKPNWMVDIRISPQDTDLPREMCPPALGFMVQIKTKMKFHVKQVIPPDFFRVDHGSQELYTSIEPNDEEPTFRIIILEYLDLVPLRLALRLGIDESKAWAELVYDVGDDESIESISNRCLEADTRRWEDQEPLKKLSDFRLLLSGFVQTVVHLGRKERSTLQPGSHWARIEIEKQTKPSNSGTILPGLRSFSSSPFSSPLASLGTTPSSPPHILASKVSI
ncbi:HET-domain-containing protein [Dendrothele bispora CBS 962.96]|uniref:HET-domain-containing protein n=1 Tax=Dendrothele bispora (strain CBS 962.96) TaxID=1314807 RepID=A0A4S8KT30_DENBC|nr:HET-domain-containing protein [Dendrothele bispora CBS 962.96]